MACDHYHQKALECLWAARRMSEPSERLTLLTVARQFALLAAHVRERADCGTYVSGENIAPRTIEGAVDQ
jgi:hypothetical protein